jgi:ribosomal protein S18 acetylase RimI-like enzyme
MLVETAGEVRALVRGGTEVGYYWIEERERTLHVHAIFVLPEYRSQGIGAWAFHMLDSEFRRRCDYIELGVRGDNVRAQAFYRRLGFETERQIPRPSFLIMRKPLSSAA